MISLLPIRKDGPAQSGTHSDSVMGAVAPFKPGPRSRKKKRSDGFNAAPHLMGGGGLDVLKYDSSEPRDGHGKWTASEAAQTIRNVLIDSDRGTAYRGAANALTGHCYVASEAAYHLLGGKKAGWKPMFMNHEGEPHWFLRNDRLDQNLDITEGQFDTPPDHSKATGKGFLTKRPSKRAQAVIDRAEAARSQPPVSGRTWTPESPEMNAVSAKFKEGFLPRFQMPQLSGFPIPGTPASKLPTHSDLGKVEISQLFRSDLVSSGVKVTDETIPAESLHPIQNEIDERKVAGMIRRHLADGLDNIQPMWVSSDDKVIDGHHRWATYIAEGMMTGKPTMIPVIRVNLPAKELVNRCNAFADKIGIQRQDVAKALWMVKAFDPDEARDQTGRWTVVGGASIDEVTDKMGANDTDDPSSRHPENYEPNKGFGVHLKEGAIETRTGTDADGRPIRYQVKATNMDDVPGDTPQDKFSLNDVKGGSSGLGARTPDGKTLLDVKIPGSEEPAPLYRMISEEDWQRAQKNGYIQSDGRMNLADEGTVAADRSTGAFYAVHGRNRLLRIEQKPGVNWKRDPIDSYVKTHDKIPLDHVSMVSKPIDYDKNSGATKISEETDPVAITDAAENKSQVGQIISTGIANGGFTWNPHDGTTPRSGYVVAIQGHSKILPYSPDDPDAWDKLRTSFVDFYKQNKNFFTDPAIHLGGWYDKDHNEFVFDPVEVVDDLDQATKLGRDRNQQAIWDIANGTEIDTGGTGDREDEASVGKAASRRRNGRGDRSMGRSVPAVGPRGRSFNLNLLPVFPDPTGITRGVAARRTDPPAGVADPVEKVGRANPKVAEMLTKAAHDVSDEARGQPGNPGEWAKSPSPASTPIHQPVPSTLARVSAPRPSSADAIRERAANGGIEPPTRLEVSMLDSEGKGNKKGNNAGGMEKALRRQKTVPGFEDINPEQAKSVEVVIARQQANIKDMIDLSVALSPSGTKAHARWYPIARKIAEKWSAESHHRFPLDAVMADIAIISPGQDWADNLAWSKYILDTIDNEENLKVTQADIDGKDAGKIASYELARKDKTRQTPPEPPVPCSLTVGQTVKSMTDMQVVEYLRGHAEATGKLHQIGGLPGFGDPDTIARPNTDQFMANAVSVLRNPTEENIDQKLGSQLKVRSFYNNISEPLDDEYQDVTADTHHFGVANGVPFGVSHPLVKSGKDNITATPSIAATGAMGTYPMVVEATRRATAVSNVEHVDEIERIAPDQGQSIAWTMWKALYPSSIRKPKFQNYMADQHRLRNAGKIDRTTMNLNIEAERLRYRDAQQKRFDKEKTPEARAAAVARSKKNGSYIPTWEEIGQQFDQEAIDMEREWPTDSQG